MLIVDYLLWILLDSYDHTRRQSCAGDCMHVICSRDPRISVRFVSPDTDRLWTGGPSLAKTDVTVSGSLAGLARLVHTS